MKKFILIGHNLQTSLSIREALEINGILIEEFLCLQTAREIRELFAPITELKNVDRPRELIESVQAVNPIVVITSRIIFNDLGDPMNLDGYLGILVKKWAFKGDIIAATTSSYGNSALMDAGAKRRVDNKFVDCHNPPELSSDEIIEGLIPLLKPAA